jgi:hypothetical protein
VSGPAPAGSGPTAPLSALAPRTRYLARMLRSAVLSLSLVAVTLGIGVVGYRQIAGLSWLVAFHQSALLLAGMGPVETQLNDGGRIFESLYALFCGIVLLGATAILFAPLVHRFLHRFHLEDGGR